MGAALSTAGCAISSNPDIAGVGARIAVYSQNVLCFLPAVWAIADEKLTDYELDSMETMSTTNLVVAFGILISCFIQASTLGLSNFHASIVLSMSWMNNTNVFIYFLLYAAQLKEKDAGWLKTLKDRIASKIKSRFQSLFRLTTVETSPADTEAGDGTQQNTASSPAARAVPPAPSLTIRQLFRRVSLVFGSLHLTLMSALGLWLWSGPRTFGSSDSACAVDHAHLAIAGARVPFGSSALRAFSLFIYGLFLIPGFNLVIPTAVFITLYIWHGKLDAVRCPPKPEATANATESGETALDLARKQRSMPVTKYVWSVVRRISSPRSPVFPAFVGLCFLLAINIIFIVDIELTLKANKKIQESGEAEWGFGQVLAVLLLFLPLRDLVEMIFRRRQELQTQVDIALRKAINNRNPEDALKWVTAGANPNIKTDDNWTALDVAIHTQRKDIGGSLIRLGADVNATLAAATPTTNSDKVFIKICSGADMNVELNAATRARDKDSVLLLVGSGADVDSSLRVAIHARDWDGVRLLIEAGADINIELDDGQSALEVATRAANLDDIRTLLELNANINAEFKDGTRALEVAAMAKQWDLVSEIVNAGADVRTPFKDGIRTALYAACQNAEGPPAVIELLLERGADANSRGGVWNETSLYKVCRAGRDDLVELLLAHGADPTLQDKYGDTPLHSACYNGKSKCVGVLLKHAKDPADLANTKNNNGWTPLHQAHRGGHQDCIKLLLANGADNTIKDVFGETPVGRF